MLGLVPLLTLIGDIAIHSSSDLHQACCPFDRVEEDNDVDMNQSRMIIHIVIKLSEEVGPVRYRHCWRILLDAAMRVRGH